MPAGADEGAGAVGHGTAVLAEHANDVAETVACLDDGGAIPSNLDVLELAHVDDKRAILATEAIRDVAVLAGD